MKIKGIPVWEQYLEFIMLGVAVLVFAGFAAMQFLSNPNVVSTPQGDVGPGTVDEKLEEVAQNVRNKLDSRAGVDLEDPEPLSEVFEERLAASVVPPDQLKMPQIAMTLDETDEPIGVVDKPFLVPVVPVPQEIAVAQYYDGLSPGLVENQEQLKERFTEAPYDVTWVTAAADFNIADLLAQYKADDPSGERVSLPPSWFENRVYMFDVALERAQRAENGQWGDATLIAALPGTYNFGIRRDLTERPDATLRDTLIRELSEESRQRQVVQPPFYDSGAWSPPEPLQDEVEAAELTEEEQKIRDLQRQLRTSQDRVTRQLERLEELGGPLDDDGGGGTGGGGRGGGGMGGGGGRGPGGGGGRGPGGRGPGGQGGAGGDRGDSPEDIKRKRIGLTRQLRKYERSVEQIQDKLAALGVNIDQEEEVEIALPLWQEEQIRIWRHDMTVEPGKTYRYRFSVRVHNPFFARRINLIEEQHELAANITMDSTYSDWSDPVTVEPPLQIFVTSAAAASDNVRPVGRMGLGQAAVDVFRFQDGRWWMAQFKNLSPGDRIGGIKEQKLPESANGNGAMNPRPAMVEIDFSTDWYLLDILKEMEGEGSSLRSPPTAVVLQNIDTNLGTQIRRPRVDQKNAQKQELEDEVSLAETG